MSGEFCMYLNYFWSRNIRFLQGLDEVLRLWKVFKMSKRLIFSRNADKWSFTLRSPSETVRMVVLCLFCAVFFAHFPSFVLWIPLCSVVTSSRSPLVGRVPQVAVEPRRAPQKRRLMGSTGLPSRCDKNHVGILVSL